MQPLPVVHPLDSHCFIAGSERFSANFLTIFTKGSRMINGGTLRPSIS